MKRFFVSDDDRMKTGRIAFLVLLSVIAGCTLVYYMGKPADKVLLAVKHVFEAEETPALKPKPDAEPEPPKESSRKEGSVEAEEQAEKSAGKSDAPPEPSIHQAPGPQTQKDLHAGAPDTSLGEATEKAVEKKREKAPAATVAEAKPPAPGISGENNRQPVRFNSFPGVQPEASAQEEGKTGEGALSASDYLAVHKSWRESGAQGSGEGNIPLRIENLKAVYSLFQMKAVALRGDKPYVDLSDGTRIAGGALSPYSTTCFRVADPFDQWGSELEKAGLTPGNPVAVRYYMYETIRNAIYARAARAVECCRQQGLIPEGVSADEVDLLGRAYAIRRQGGGGFGVFVPVGIDLPDGRTIAVDPACFAGSADIDHLMASGQL